MRAVAQRVSAAHVAVDGRRVGEISAGLLVYLGAGQQDGTEQVRWMANKLAGLRIFAGEDGRMTLDVREAGGEMLIVPQFTLYGDVRKGRRPSFEAAGPPEQARALFEQVCQALVELGLCVASGQFQAHMDVHCAVDGPVTILIDSDRVF